MPVLFSAQAEDDLADSSAYLRRDPLACAISVITSLRGQHPVEQWEYARFGRRRITLEDLVFEYDTHPDHVMVVRVNAIAHTVRAARRTIPRRRRSTESTSSAPN